MSLKIVEKFYQAIIMSIKHAFIPCAGKGSRMGEVGKKLAKPLWNIFDKSMLDIQCDYLNNFFGINNISINTSHLSYQFDSNDKISKLYEPTLLGSGGNIHNLKKNNSDIDKVIIINPDINLFLSESDLNLLKKDFEENDFVMVCLPVKAGESYNEVNINDGFFSHVSGPNSEQDYVTYSGFGMLNLEKILYCEGESSFFDSVINNKSPCKIFIPGEEYEYWDWGTKELYVENIRRLLNLGFESKMYTFLEASGAIDTSVVGKNSYRSKNKNSYCFIRDDISLEEGSILVGKVKDRPLLVKV